MSEAAAIRLRCSRCQSERVHVREHVEYATTASDLAAHTKRALECCSCGLTRPHGSPDFSPWKVRSTVA